MNHRKTSRPAPARAAHRIRPLILSLAALGATAHAESPHSQADRVIVTGNPLRSESFELAPAISVLSGRELGLKREGTLGETVAGLPGVSSSYFGPNASRPIIRGLDGDRVRLLEDGIGATDASSLSYDHATTVEPLLIDRVEVMRGPAALMYGGNAIGGVVNSIDHRIPTESPQGISGRAEVRLGGAAEEAGGAAMVDVGNDSFALHVDAFSRDTNNLKIPGAAVSDRLRAQVDVGEAEVSDALLEANGTLPNSAAVTNGGAVGASWLGEQGYLGISWGHYHTLYGTVAEPEVTIDMKSDRFDIAGELRQPMPGIGNIKGKLRSTDYEHTELDAGAPATVFSNKGWEARFDATHDKLGGLTGAFGLQASNNDFSALGDEAFVPSTNTTSIAGFVFEEAVLGPLRLSAGGRFENNEVSSEGGDRWGAADTRSFNLLSGALGAVWTLAPGWALAANLAHSDRAPTFYELFADGPHAATGAYEVGNRDFDNEDSNAVDLFLRYKASGLSASVGGFYTRFGNYIGLLPSGQLRGADGAYNPDPAVDEVLPEYVYTQVPAEFTGLEAEANVLLSEGAAGRFDLALRADMVRAKRTDTGEWLPRIAPGRVGATLDWERGIWGAQLQWQYVAEQTRTAPNELPTDAYNLIHAAVSARIKTDRVTWDAWLKGNNLTNAEARNHASFLKDVSPMAGRGVLAGLRASF